MRDAAFASLEAMAKVLLAISHCSSSQCHVFIVKFDSFLFPKLEGHSPRFTAATILISRFFFLFQWVGAGPSEELLEKLDDVRWKNFPEMNDYSGGPVCTSSGLELLSILFNLQSCTLFFC